MPISITNRTEKGSELSYAEMDAILEALAAALGVVISPSQPSDGTCPLWLDTTNASSPTLKVWDGSAWNPIKGGSAPFYLMQKHRSI